MEISFNETGGTIVPGSAYYEQSANSDWFSLFVEVFDSDDFPNVSMDFLLLESPGEDIVSFYTHLTNLYLAAKSREDFIAKIRKASQKKRRS